MSKFNKIQLPIGRDIFTDEEVNFALGKFGVHLILGKTRSGKSNITKNILAFLFSQSKKKLIIFDPYSEYVQIKYPNFRNDGYMRSYPNVKVIRDFGFMMEDFDAGDLSALGLPEVACNILYRIMQCKSLHGGYPSEAVKVCKKLPKTDAMLKDWNAEFPELELPAKIPDATYTSLNNRFGFISGFFLDPDETDKIVDFQKEAQNHNLIIDFNLRDAFMKGAYPFFAGVILKQIRPINEKIKPIYVIDEIDLLAPNNEIVTPAHNLIIEMAIKQQRQGICLIGVTQAPNLLTTELTTNFHSKIVGKLGNYSDDFERQISRKLYCNFETNQRQFALVTMNDEAKIFWAYAPSYYD